VLMWNRKWETRPGTPKPFSEFCFGFLKKTERNSEFGSGSPGHP